ncbi:MAG: hypothetical protein ACK4OF_01550 [Aquificaceae bacterium]
MSFYVFAFLIAFLQSAILSALFQSAFFTPNLLLGYLFLKLLEREDLKNIILAGLFLDLFQDSLGLNLSGFILFTLSLSLFKMRFELPSRLSIVAVYAILALLEKLWVLLLLRSNYHVELNLVTLFISYGIELGFVLFLSRWYRG